MNMLRWVAPAERGHASRLRGVTPIGSGDAPTGNAGSTGMSAGGMMSVGDGGQAPRARAQHVARGAGNGRNTSAGAAGKDPGTGGITQTDG